MRAFLIFFSIVISSSAYSQVPGFMGRRFTVFLEANPTPALFVQNTNNELITYGDNALTQKKNRFAFNFRPQITVEYLVHRDVSIGLSYSRISVGSALATLTDSTAIEKFTLTGNVVKGQAVGLHIKLYQFGNSASIAPIGFYHTISGYITQTNAYANSSSSTKQFKTDFVYPVVSYSVGRQSMIAKNLLLKTGVEFGWAFVPLNFLSKADQDNWTAQQYSEYNVHRSLFGHYMFNINIALGYNFF